MSEALDIDRLRAETPGCEDLLHFDNAGASLQPAPVRQAVFEHLALEQTIGGYAAEDQAQVLLDGLYDSVAGLLNCHQGEIAFAENATRAWDMAFYGLKLAPGDVILTSGAEYASNMLAFLHQARRTGAEVVVVPDAEAGGVDVAALADRLDGRVKLVAISHVPSQSGLVQPAAQIGALARAAGIPFLLDACQSVGQLPVDVEALGCDFLAGTGRKYLRGPRGTGFLFVRRSWIERLDPPFIDLKAATWTSAKDYQLRPDARRFENWESFVAGRLGLKAAVDYARTVGLEAIAGRVGALARELRDQLRGRRGIRVVDPGSHLCGIVTFTVEWIDLNVLHGRLRDEAMNTTVVTTPTARLDFASRRLSAVLRASVHYYNTEAEIAAFCAALDRLAG